MKKQFTAELLFFFFCLSGSLHAQDLPSQQGLEPNSLTNDELMVLSNIPILRLPEQYKGANAPLLPQGVDNSTQPYFRPITTQSGYECGQSASIAFNFTYEIDRLRGLPANVATNQYPTHFAWDFLNNANNYLGVSFFDSWEIIKTCGTMNVSDYGGGLNTGGYLRWISGYDKYYNGMQNRLNTVSAIRADSPEGLLTLKYWLAEHLDGSVVGGIGNIYGNYFGSVSTVLPPGTPEAGKFVQTNWGGSPSHAWTICGYNDSIRYDFNGDGQYTNNLDINGDGLTDMHDWEIGGLKFANGYAGTGWCNQGFCYTMYKNIADNIGYGGIWNHSIYVIDVKQSCAPKLTMKVTLKHPSRNKLKISAGLNPDITATIPSNIIEFPIFNFQGGDYYMQGGSSETDKTIEFGIDLTPLLSNLISGQTAKYFLQVQEVDPENTATGTIVNWSLIDYTSGSPLFNNYPGTNVAITNNSITRLSLNHTINFSKPGISTLTIPPAPLYQPFSFQLTSNGGTPPYLYDAALDYPESVSSAPFPTTNALQLTLTNNNSGYAIKQLDFSFPFYKKNVNKIYVYADGYILFDDQPYTWPFLIDKTLLFRQSAIISPFMVDMTVSPSQGQGIWYEGNQAGATFRWKTSITGMSSTVLNFAVKLYPSGKIEFYYGDMVYPATTVWTGGISSGDNKNYQNSLLNNSPVINANTLDQFTACGFPSEMQITEDGTFSGTPTIPYQNLPVRFIVTDNNNISSIKSLLFSTNGLFIDYSVESGSDSIIECGETAYLNLSLTNLSTQPASGIQLSVSNTDPYVTLVNSFITVPLVNGGQTITLTHAFSMQISPSIPNNHAFTLPLSLIAPQQNSQIEIPLMAYAPEFRISKVEFPDGDNQHPDPGESADLFVTFVNKGGVAASGVNLTLVSADTNINVNISSGYLPYLKPDSAAIIPFHITASSYAPFEHLYKMNTLIHTSLNQNTSDSLFLYSGEIIEDFETGNLHRFDWFTSGSSMWGVDPSLIYEGNYAARSGWITDNQEVTLLINVCVLQSGTLSFWKKVSCEHDPTGAYNYDYLSFRIDNFEIQRWDGEDGWSKVSFEVQQGYHTFSWVYHKDYSVSSGYDCAFLDFIEFPLITGVQPVLSVHPQLFEKTVESGSILSDQINVVNTGGGILSFSSIVFDTGGKKKSSYPSNQTSSYLECSTEYFVPGQALEVNLMLHNQSNDNENISHVKLDVPPGVAVNAATNFAGGSLGELIYQGTAGSGLPQNWHGVTSGGAGVVKPGEIAVSSLSMTVNNSYQDDIFLVYNVHGDQSGASPHDNPGFIKITNSGLWNDWLSLSGNSDSLFSNESATVGVTFNSGNLTPGDYSCQIIVRDYYNNKQVIPVLLHVTDQSSLVTTEQSAFTSFAGNFPNPFSNNTTIQYHLANPGEVDFEIFNSQGTIVKTFYQNQIFPGNYSLIWNGSDLSGKPVPEGVYFCRMRTIDYSKTWSMILIR